MKHHSPTQHAGVEAEKIAMDYLRKKGLKLVTRNFATKFGEIDLIMEDRTTLVFIEVRSRSGSFMSALETIDLYKQRKIVFTALRYLQCYPTPKACRFDVISMKTNAKAIEIHWIKDAFQVE